MIIRNAEFITSAVEPFQYPDWQIPEIAMVGRSNVGKSSLINALCNRKGLARVAAAPGKTRLINFYNINSQFALVDLAGYGYARVGKEMKASWGRMIETYLKVRLQFSVALLLLDIRHDPTEDDKLMESWMRADGRPYVIVLTKIDKLTRQDQMSRRKAIQEILDLPSEVPLIPVSSEKRQGISELWDLVESALSL
jgi:GTP-binding protein